VVGVRAAAELSPAVLVDRSDDLDRNASLDTYLVLDTDGVTEARRGAELLGEKRLLEVVADLRGSSAQEVAAGVRDAALAFAGRLRDDLQVVVLRLA
jgi:serine phosphatase RsbU (regulator of sigma subunit)